MTRSLDDGASARRAQVADAPVVAQLLDRFNREYDAPTPGPTVLTTRLEALLAGDNVFGMIVGEPAFGFALVTMRPNVWYDGPVGLLDELYVEPIHRNRGIGSTLLQAAEAQTRSLGGELLEINVDSPDTDARRFYARHGYVNHERGDDQPLLYYYRELVDRSTPVTPEAGAAEPITSGADKSKPYSTAPARG